VDVDVRHGPVSVRHWPGCSDVVQLVVTDPHHVPTAADVDAWTATCAGRGASVVRTSALYPSAAAAFEGSGYRVIDRLALLEIDPARRVRPRSARPTRRMRRSDLAPVIDVDRRAFPPMWAHDRASLADARSATPRSRARVVDRRGGIAGYALGGRAGRTGYLQRLAVDPDQQRLGIGRSLVEDALASFQRHRVGNVMVNTAVDNEPALALYRSVGFRRCSTELVICERSL
jgi:ribosomal protein S18 acetylase RimI-like enzyme